jgi:hypothetical protein
MRSGPVLWPPLSPDLTNVHFNTWEILKHTLAYKTANICDKLCRLVKGAAKILTHVAKIIQRTESSWYHTAHSDVQESGPHFQQNLWTLY